MLSSPEAGRTNSQDCHNDGMQKSPTRLPQSQHFVLFGGGRHDRTGSNKTNGQTTTPILHFETPCSDTVLRGIWPVPGSCRTPSALAPAFTCRVVHDCVRSSKYRKMRRKDCSNCNMQAPPPGDDGRDCATKPTSLTKDRAPQNSTPTHSVAHRLLYNYLCSSCHVARLRGRPHPRRRREFCPSWVQASKATKQTKERRTYPKQASKPAPEILPGAFRGPHRDPESSPEGVPGETEPPYTSTQERPLEATASGDRGPGSPATKQRWRRGLLRIVALRSGEPPETLAVATSELARPVSTRCHGLPSACAPVSSCASLFHQGLGVVPDIRCPGVARHSTRAVPLHSGLVHAADVGDSFAIVASESCRGRVPAAARAPLSLAKSFIE